MNENGPAEHKHAFISHSTPDDGYVAEFESLLRFTYYTEVFNDSRSIPAGEEFWPIIEREIRRCESLFVVISDASAGSPWVKEEVELARRLGKKVLGVWIEDCEVPSDFKQYDIIDFRPKRRVKDRKIATSRILRHSPPILFGREKWLEALDAAWNDQHLNLYTLVAWGGVGKTSLVAHWIAERLMKRGWPGVERYFDWSFYSQGTGESRQTSASLFITQALTFFGDPDPMRGGLWDRGERLAKLTRQHRTLLVLDGIEPLQFPPTDKSGQAGRLKDPALEALVQSLAADNPGLCVITTREHLKNVEALPTTEEKKLDRLLKEAAIALLRNLQIVGTEEELEAAWKDAGGHALTLQLLGRFIADAYPDRDIRHYKQVHFVEAEEERSQGRSAFKVMIAYEKWFHESGPPQQRELAILRLTGLFDRPISANCLQALRAEPAIPGLTDVLVKLKETQWNIALARLIDIDLLSRSGLEIDAHPLVRMYFAEQLQRNSPDAFQAAHSRLFDHLCDTTPREPTELVALGLIYQAVIHGCLARRYKEACGLYRDRIICIEDVYGHLRRRPNYGEAIGAIAAFFDEPWMQVSPNLSTPDQAYVLDEAATNLRALGRLSEAVAPTRMAISIVVAQNDWTRAARYLNDLARMETMLGLLIDATDTAKRAIELADRSGHWSSLLARCTAAEIHHQMGCQAEARALFDAAEQERNQPELSFLYSVRGFQYVDFLISSAECEAWRRILNGRDLPADTKACEVAAMADVERRIRAVTNNRDLDRVTCALNNLATVRVRLFRSILASFDKPETVDLQSEIPDALAKFRKANTRHHLPKALLTAAFYAGTLGEQPDEARRYLAEAQQIAERGPMPLYLADVHLHRARLFRDKAELAKARVLIEKHGYWRRKEELEDAEAAL